MNFLAHIYLSGNEEKTLVGNFIGDYVKGNHYLHYQPEISKGIILHRHIDSYTDSHPVTRISRDHVREHYGKYSGIIIDIFYDYFLAKDWDLYCDTPLDEFIELSFERLKRNYHLFPPRVKNWFPNFLRNKWLKSYTTVSGIENVLERMSSRTSLPDNTDNAIKTLISKKDIFKTEFSAFFPDIRNFVLNSFSVETGCVSKSTGSKEVA